MRIPRENEDSRFSRAEPYSAALIVATEQSDKPSNHVAFPLSHFYFSVSHFHFNKGGHMKISARNVLSGTVSSITHGVVNTEVVVGLKGGDEITATITLTSAKALELAVGKPVTALIKAYSVMVMLPNAGLRLSARNSLAGRVTRISSAPVSTEVTIALRGGDEVHAVITHDALSDLGLKQGTDVIAVIKASSVVIAVSA